ncbi:MAG: thiamine phosphate synthase [Endomicrobium sp.]|jgi:thiamine-phosphate pyrophosphorylase|nr:thiamine phosphate synthase [Endomicrobium sp.]
MKKQTPKGLYAITAENFSNGRDNITVVKEMLDAGVKTLQYRDKYKTKLEKFNQCETIRKLTSDYNVFFVVNDDIDIALAVESDGLHLGQDDLPILKARSIVGDNMAIGVSTHSPAQALAAQEQGVDYIGVGPIFKTFTKDNVCTPVGIEYLKYCVKNIKVHKVAIGGIKLSNIGQICKFRPDSICMVTEITASPNIKNTVRQALEGINDNN